MLKITNPTTTLFIKMPNPTSKYKKSMNRLSSLLLTFRITEYIHIKFSLEVSNF